jgi:AraC family transcriptional regulator, regulatory protein of adaptative response / methylated-DNA-[protein]-cysteine methyltransferase
LEDLMMPAEQQPGTEEKRWKTVVSRDGNAAATFYYGVRTTGVFCRPGCASRLPRRDNVEFFDSCRDAERAGYRPCRRCRPGTASRKEKMTALMVSVCRAIEQADMDMPLSELAGRTHLSPGHLHRLFKKIVGVTPKQYAALTRSQKFRRSLKAGQSVTEAIYQAGYGSSSRVYEKALDRLAMTPGSYKNGGKGLVLQFAVATCSLGPVLVAATERGICAIEFGEDRHALAERLRKSFPQAQLRAADAAFSSIIGEVIALIEAPDNECRLPLDIRGSAFQERVWSALRNIRPGTTASYSEIARRIGRPAAARAVANACAANPLAVAVPCHRVVRSDGRISGYKWGVERKHALLAREKNGGDGSVPVADVLE